MSENQFVEIVIYGWIDEYGLKIFRVVASSMFNWLRIATYSYEIIIFKNLLNYDIITICCDRQQTRFYSDITASH